VNATRLKALQIAIFVVAVGSYFAWRTGIVGGAAKPVNHVQSGAVVLALGGGLAAPAVAGAAEPTFTEALSKALGTPVLARGVAGATATDTAARAADVIVTDKPNFVVVTLGQEDLAARVTLDETMRGYGETIQAIQAGGAMAVVLGLDAPDVGDNWAMALRDLARGRGALWVEDPLRGRWQDGEAAKNLVPTAAEKEALAAGVAAALGPYLSR
jgi:hypothetical protein